MGLKLSKTKPKISGTVPTDRHTTIPNHSGATSACFNDDPKLLNCEIPQPSGVGAISQQLHTLRPSSVSTSRKRADCYKDPPSIPKKHPCNLARATYQYPLVSITIVDIGSLRPQINKMIVHFGVREASRGVLAPVGRSIERIVRIISFIRWTCGFNTVSLRF